ncbi:hypothetical protein GWI33_000628 [Rhynchophorus ferrugineus]|uniref:Uncharacterized protein n=1 Tax=Rhynchophorus ferrugineus TaxID=354439 RepID=A0A834MKD7_RHYFE|nr:hypothetical protein GWI33_000628 [Rhynchophorus ferrugineus]
MEGSYNNNLTWKRETIRTVTISRNVSWQVLKMRLLRAQGTNRKEPDYNILQLQRQQYQLKKVFKSLKQIIQKKNTHLRPMNQDLANSNSPV